MGRMRAMEAATTMREMVGMERALEYHLTANHFPPVPTSMIGPSKLAIEALVNDEPDTMIDLPSGVYYKGDTKQAPAHAVVEAHHLEDFVMALRFEDDYEDEEE